MSFENQSGSAAGADFKPAPLYKEAEPLTPSYVESERTSTRDSDTEKTKTDALSGTTDGGDKTNTPLSAQGYAKALYGDTGVQWGQQQSEPAVLDLAAGEDFLTDPFSEKFNKLPEKGKEDNKGLSGDQTKPTTDATPQADKPAGDNPDLAKPTTEKPTKDPADKASTTATDTPANPGSPTSTETPVAKEEPDAKEKPAGSDKGPKGFNPFEAAGQVGDFLGFNGDKEAARIVSNAQNGKSNLDAHDAQYLKQWRGPAENGGKLAPPAEGDDPNKYTHKNADGSSYEVTNGKMSAFTTAPTKDAPNGHTYSDIQYDKNNQVTSYTTPFGQKHTRTTEPNANGFANWKATTLDGKPATYGGANAGNWLGKPEFNETGFHNLIGNGTYGGHMFSRGMDGSHTMTRPEYSKGKMTGLETTTTLADNTAVSRKGTFDAGNKLQQNNADITVKEGDGPKFSHVGFDEAGKGKVKDVAKPTDKTAAAAKGSDMMGLFGKMLAPGGMDGLKDVQELNAQRTGPGQFRISGDLNNVYMPPPNISVGGFGPLGRISATPNGGVVDKFSMDMSFDNNHVSARNIQGVHGSASLSRTNMFGRTRDLGRSVPTRTTGMDWDMNSNTMLAHSDRSPTRLNANNFNRDSLSGRLLSDEGAEQKARETLQALDKNVNSFHLKQTKPGEFQGSLDLRANQMEIANLPGLKTNLYMDDKIDFTKTQSGLNFKPGEVQLGTQVGSGVEQRRDISSISQGVVDGKPVMKVAFHDGGAPINLPIPDGSAQPAKPGQPAKPEAPAPRADAPARTAPQRAADHPVQRAQSQPVRHEQRQSNDCQPSNHHRRGLFRRR